jgi:hypothetical protein
MSAAIAVAPQPRAERRSYAHAVHVANDEVAEPQPRVHVATAEGPESSADPLTDGERAMLDFLVGFAVERLLA